MNSLHRPHVILGRTGERAAIVEAEVRMPSRKIQGTLLFRASGNPYEISRLLPLLRYLVRTKRGAELRERLASLQSYFRSWRERRKASLS